MSQRELVFRVSVAGQEEFARVMLSMNQLTKRLAVDEQVTARARTQGVVRERETAAREEKRIAERVAREKSRIQQEEFRRSVKARNDDTRAAEKSEKDKLSAAEKAAKERERFAERAGRRIVAALDREVRDVERAEREKTRAIERELRSQIRARDAADRQLARGVGMSMLAGARGVGASASHLLMRGASTITGATGISNAYDVSSIIRERYDVQRILRRVSIEARQAGEGWGGFDEAGAYDKIRKTAKTYGIKQDELAGAIDVYSEKGSGATAVENIDRIAKQAVAMGTDVGTVAKLRAQMGISSKVAGKELSEQEKDWLVARMHFVGKTGVFRAEDLAAESEQLFSQFAKSGGDFREGFNRYLGFANEARKSTGSGATARTAINAVQQQIEKKEALIQSLGVKTRDKDGDRRDFVDIVMDTIEKTGGQGKTYLKIFDPAKSGKATATLETAFRAAEKEKKGSGRAAMENLLSGDESLKNASVDEMYKDTNKALETEETKIAQNVEELRQTISTNLAPALTKLAEVMPLAVQHITSLVSWVKANPTSAAAIAGTGTFLAHAGPGIGAAGLERLFSAGLSGVGGIIGGGAGKGLGALGSLLDKATAMPVHIVSAAPGVFGGGGGGGGGGLPPPVPGGGGAGPTVPGLGPFLGSTPVLGAALAATIAYMAIDPDGQYGEGGQRKMLNAQGDQARYEELKAQGYSKEDAEKYLHSETPAELLDTWQRKDTVDATAERGKKRGDPAELAAYAQTYLGTLKDPEYQASPYESPDGFMGAQFGGGKGPLIANAGSTGPTASMAPGMEQFSKASAAVAELTTQVSSLASTLRDVNANKSPLMTPVRK
jgi:hypothetical protein